eukprot:1157989-Pelagomonas_calceolata.AAC.3
MRELNLDVQLYPPVEQQRIMVHSRPKGLLRQRKGFQNAGISCSQFPVTTRASFMLAHMPGTSSRATYHGLEQVGYEGYNGEKLAVAEGGLIGTMGLSLVGSDKKRMRKVYASQEAACIKERRQEVLMAHAALRVHKCVIPYITLLCLPALKDKCGSYSSVLRRDRTGLHAGIFCSEH